jgi:hypothetical protein
LFLDGAPVPVHDQPPHDAPLQPDAGRLRAGGAPQGRFTVTTYDADRIRIWDKLEDVERGQRKLDERQNAFDARLIAQAHEVATQRGWIYLSIGLSIVTLVLLVVELFLVVQLATYFRVLP